MVMATVVWSDPDLASVHKPNLIQACLFYSGLGKSLRKNTSIVRWEAVGFGKRMPPPDAE